MDWTSQCAGRSEEQEHNEENLRTEMQFGLKQAIRKYRKGTFGASVKGKENILENIVSMYYA